MKYKNIRVTDQIWKNISHLAIELDKSNGEVVQYLYNFYLKMMNSQNTKKGGAK